MKIDKVPGVCAVPDAETQKYIFNHTMLRIRDPKSLFGLLHPCSGNEAGA